MAGDGRVINEVTTADAAAAACLALTVWRATGRGADGKQETLAARVAWRAVVLDISADTLGDSVALHSVSDDWLFAQALPCESRVERLVRWAIERRALGRGALLLRRVEALKAHARGRRVQAAERVGHAARLMLAGDDVDTASARAAVTRRRRCRASSFFRRSLPVVVGSSCRRLAWRVSSLAAASFPPWALRARLAMSSAGRCVLSSVVG
jgi:hypothetical protein